MNGTPASTTAALRHAHRLLQIGVLLVLAGLVVGILVPRFASPRLALSTHLLAVMQGILLMVLGVVWPRLTLATAVSAAGAGLLVFGCVAAWAANLLGALWGAGNTLLPLAAGPARGTALQEGLIAALLRTGGAALIAATLIVLWGLRGTPAAAPR